MKAAKRTRNPRLTREQQREQKTEAILEGAWVTYCKKGYEGVTLDEVAEYAGVSRMPVYWLFGDKQNLFLELWKRNIDEILKRLGLREHTGRPLREKLQNLARLTVAGVTNDAPRQAEGLFFVVQTIALSRPDIAEKLDAVSAHVMDVVTEFVRASTLAKGERLRGEPGKVAAHLVAMINGMSTVQFQTHRRYATVEDLSAIFLAIALKSP